MFFRQFLHDEKSCTSYLVGCKTLGFCAAVDPQGDLDRYVKPVEANGMKLCMVIDTHVHADHVSAARELAERTGATLYLGPGADVKFAHEKLVDGQILTVGNRHIRVMHTPGHTPEHVCLHVDDWFVITGDTLFVGDVGRVDLVLEADAGVQRRAAQLHASLQRLLKLPDWTEIYPGHFSGSVCGRGIDGKAISTIGYERRDNEALALSPEAFVEFQTKNVPAAPADFQAIKRRNMGSP